MWFEAQMASAAAAEFNAQRDQILARIDPSKIGKACGKRIKGKQPVYTRKDWAPGPDRLRSRLRKLCGSDQADHPCHAPAGRPRRYQDLGVDAGWFDPLTPAIVEYSPGALSIDWQSDWQGVALGCADVPEPVPSRVSDGSPARMWASGHVAVRG